MTSSPDFLLSPAFCTSASFSGFWLISSLQQAGQPFVLAVEWAAPGSSGTAAIGPDRSVTGSLDWFSTASDNFGPLMTTSQAWTFNVDI